MTILINGPLGVGKTETAWELLERLDRGAMLDVDHVVAIKPFDFYDRVQLDYALSTVELLAGHHVANGYPDLVIDWVIEQPDDHARLVACLKRISPPVVAIHLTAPIEVIHERVRQRNRPNAAWELERAVVLQRILDTAAPSDELGIRIDTADRTVSQVAGEIIEIARHV